MEIKILKDLKNDLMERREIEFVLSADKNPGFEDAEKIVEQEFKAQKDVIVIDRIKGKFGRKTFLIKAKIYHNKGAKENIEPKTKTKKTGEGEAEEGAEKKE